MSTLNGFKGTLKQICDQMTIQPMPEATKQLFDNIKYNIEKVDMSKMPGQQNIDPRNWDRPSKAVIASDGRGSGCIVSFAGPHLDEEINQIGRQLSDLGLDDCPEGIWIWEGTYRTIRHDSIDCGTDYSTEAAGKFRHPSEVEWEYIKGNLCPWNSNDWLTREEKSKCSKCKIDFADENLSVNLCYYCFDQEMSAGNGKPEEITTDNDSKVYGPGLLESATSYWIKQEDKIIMANYDPCSQQNVEILQKQEMDKCDHSCNLLTDTCYCNAVCKECGRKNDEKMKDTRGRCMDCGWSFGSKMVTSTGRNQGKTKELAESVERLAKLSKETNTPIMMGDCIAQCLNCVWGGFDGYKCTCGSPMMSMDSSKIRKEKENGEAGRTYTMKYRQPNVTTMHLKCEGCRKGLPLGSGRYHFSTEKEINGMKIKSMSYTVPCTHDPTTGKAYVNFNCKNCGSIEHDGCLTTSLPKELDSFSVIKKSVEPNQKLWNEMVSLSNKIVEKRSLGCDCGGAKAKTTHSDWCSTVESK